MIDVSSINTIEHGLLLTITQGFPVLAHHAVKLLYYFIVFEIFFTGALFALQQTQAAERIFFQVIKIGLIIFLVQHYGYLISTLFHTVTQLGQQLSGQKNLDVLFNPGILWQYGYTYAINLLQAASVLNGFGISLIFVVMGMGILAVMGILGIQVLMQVVSFYFISAMSLLFLPFSVFSPLRDFLSQSVQRVLQASIRLMVQILIISVAMSVWSSADLLSYTGDKNINEPLGFLFTGLLFVMLSAYLPRMAEKVIGSIQWNTSPANHNTVSSVNVASHVSTPGTTRQESSARVAANAGWTSGQVVADKVSNMMTPSASSSVQYMQTLRDSFKREENTLKRFSAFTSNTDLVAIEQQRLNEIKEIKTAFLKMLDHQKDDARGYPSA